jgi:uncharacterized membrane protein YfcA
MPNPPAAPVEPESQELQGSSSDYATLLATIVFVIALLVSVVLYQQSQGVRDAFHEIARGFTTRGFWSAAGVGLVAQIVDGALGMAYGVTSTAFLLSTGVPPAAASASVHMAEVFTTGFSGLSHWKLGNVNKALFKRLLFPGVIGAVIGAFVVTSFDGNVIKPWISGYLLLMGLYILTKAFRKVVVATEPPTYIAPLALTGGFVDAVGGGGWGPVVTTSLLGSGQEPRQTIGSVNAAEFFIAAAGGLSLTVMGSLTLWTTIAGLIFGGLFAAPLAAVLAKHAPPKLLFVIVGILISGISLHNLWQVFH